MSRATPHIEMLRAALGVWAVVTCATALVFAPDLSDTTRVIGLAGVGLVATVLVVLAARRRSRRLATVERAARQIIEHEPRTLTGSSRKRLELGDTRSAPELAGLASALDELAARLDVQFKELLKKTRNLEALIDAMDEPLLATDNQEHVLLCNRSAEAVFDAEPGTLVGRPIREVLTQSELIEMHDSARAGQTRRGRVPVTTPLGRRTFQVSALPVPAAWGKGIFGAVVVLRDVTELDQSVQVKTDFVANASHELRTPVSAIRGAAETLQDAIDDDPQMSRKLAGMIKTHSVRLEEMLRDLLDLSRLESPDVPVASEPISFEEIGRALASLFEPVCTQRRLTVSFDFERELEGTRTDRKLVTIILRNLIENATKFAFEDTTIRVNGSLMEVEVEPRPSGSASSALSSGDRRVRGVVRLEVSDRGVGIPLSHQDRVFERFYQVDPARSGTGSAAAVAGSFRRGTGLGLAIVKHACKRLGGQVGLSSVWGQGTTAWAEVPVEFSENPAKRLAQAASSDERGATSNGASSGAA